MSETTNLSIRIDRRLKDEADTIFNAMGMNLTTAITVFVRQAVRQKKIPFEITLGPNDAKGEALRGARRASFRIGRHALQNGAHLKRRAFNDDGRNRRRDRRGPGRKERAVRARMKAVCVVLDTNELVSALLSPAGNPAIEGAGGGRVTINAAST